MRRSKPAPQNEFFPGFTDVAEIGVGSLATVYRAREVGTNRLVALKLLNVRDASARALESFERESIALGAVSSHPNIVTLFRSFPAADQRPVLVLELCRGSVGDRMHGGAGLPAAEVVALGIKIAGALETAHRAEILHRDVKPQNILVTEFGEPALADFGVAMLQSSTQTTAGLFDFTTLHAAPELLEGGDTSAATDVYELASTLYQLIAGRAAFRAYDGESPASVILRILRDPVQPLVNTQAPQSLSDLLLYAMSKDQRSRPPTAAEFAAELAAVEVEQQWPRTQFLIRDATGGTTGLPTITRLPELGRRTTVQSAARPPVDDWSAPTVVSHPADAPPAAVAAGPESTIMPAALDPRPTNERVLVERQVIERVYFDVAPPPPSPPLPPPPPADDGWSAVSLVRARSEQTEPQTWSPPPPPEVIEADVPLPPTRETRVVQLADPAALFPPAPEPVAPEPVSPEPAMPEPVSAEPDLASIWGAVVDLPPPTAAPPPADVDLPPPAHVDPPPPDPATRISEPPEPSPPEPTPPEPAEPEPTPPEPAEPEPEAPLPFVPWRGALTEPDPFETGEHRVDPASLAAAAATPSDGQPPQYPIPPSGLPGDVPVDGAAGTVPTWAFRAAAHPQPGQASYGDLVLDPTSLRSKVTLRAGTASLTVDDAGLALRSRMRRSTIPWSEVLGFEPRFDEAGRDARLVVHTHTGPVELTATRRPPGEVRYIHALLDAYRQRAAMAGPR